MQKPIKAIEVRTLSLKEKLNIASFLKDKIVVLGGTSPTSGKPLIRYKEGYDDSTVLETLSPRIERLTMNHIRSLRAEVFGVLSGHTTPKPPPPELDLKNSEKPDTLKLVGDIGVLKQLIDNLTKSFMDLQSRIGAFEGRLANIEGRIGQNEKLSNDRNNAIVALFDKSNEARGVIETRIGKLELALKHNK